MHRVFGVLVPVVEGRKPEVVEARFAMPRRGAVGRGGAPIVYEYTRYRSWAEAERETGLTRAKLRWDILKAAGMP